MALVRLWTKYRDSRFDDCYRDFHCAELFDTKVPEAEPYHGKWAYPWQSEVADAAISTIALNDSDEFHIIIYAEFDEDTEEGRIIGVCWIALPQNQSSYMIAYIARSLDYRGCGIGSSLLEHALAFVKVNAMQRGIPHRIQTLIDKRNRESRALFERYGFTQPRPGFEYNGRYLEYVLDTESPIWDGHRP